ncbi:hypothetical protein [Dysosmobacter sp.]
MSELAAAALSHGVSVFILLFLILPAALIFLGYLIYIVIMTIRELRKK